VRREGGICVSMRNTLTVIIFLVLTLSAGVLLSEVISSPGLELVFFDVEQGDAIFFETPQGNQVLLDGGPNSKVLTRLGAVMPFWDKSLDLVILSHPDADHITGLVAVFEHYEVQNVLWTGKQKETKVFKAFLEALEREGANVYQAVAGQHIGFENSDLVLEILYPTKEIDLEKEESNETSIIAKLEYGDTTVLLTGDTTKKIEKRLVQDGVNLEANILKVAHHGSKTSSTKEFLSQVKPEIAVISVGKENRFSHPTEEILANLAEYGIQVRRTDKEGTIFFTLY
jgi:competence protein ComEC